MSEKPAIVVVTQNAMSTAHRIREQLPDSIIYGYHKRTKLSDITFENVGETLRELFTKKQPIIALMSSGIVIRTLRHLLKDKYKEPPVLVVSEDGRFIIPLLGGHAGANQIAENLANALHGHAALTTTSETRFGTALDSPPKGWILANPKDHKAFVAQLLAGEGVQIDGKLEWLAVDKLPNNASGPLKITETIRAIKGSSYHLVYHPAKLSLGIGCERGVSFEEIRSLVDKTLANAGLSVLAIAGLFSLDIKSDEPAIQQLEKYLNVDARFFNATTLEHQTPRLLTPSEIVFREVGCHGVAESAALAAAGVTGQLLVAKVKSPRATCAIAESPDIIVADKIGQARGQLYVVGLGPGDYTSRSAIVTRILADAQDLVGFKGYLDLIKTTKPEQVLHAYKLGEEIDRVRDALNLASTGRRVVLVCSGDPGVYAMASLVFELIDKARTYPHLKTWSHIQIEILPGISAMQTAAARVGAPLGHDFCAISLSDLLTPWRFIEKRIHAAADADFVIAFYNPRSKARSSQLEKAIEILRTHRSSDTPVVIARNLGRQGESTSVCKLSTFDCTEVDMLSIVIVGSSTTRMYRLGENEWVYTPRGYHKKNDWEIA